MSSYQDSLIEASRVAGSPAPAAGAAPIPAAGPGFEREVEEALIDGDLDDDLDPSTEDDDIDPNEFDLMLSHSIQSGGSVLESECVEHSMLRGPRRYSRTRIAQPNS